MQTISQLRGLGRFAARASIPFHKAGAWAENVMGRYLTLGERVAVLQGYNDERADMVD